jgi:hypothetical protein
MERLLTLPPEALATIVVRFQASDDDPRPTGSKAHATWPANIRALADRLYAAGIAAHRLQVFWRWFFDDPDAESDLAAVIPWSSSPCCLGPRSPALAPTPPA